MKKTYSIILDTHTNRYISSETYSTVCSKLYQLHDQMGINKKRLLDIKFIYEPLAGVLDNDTTTYVSVALHRDARTTNLERRHRRNLKKKQKKKSC